MAMETSRNNSKILVDRQAQSFIIKENTLRIFGFVDVQNSVSKPILQLSVCYFLFFHILYIFKNVAKLVFYFEYTKFMFVFFQILILF